MAGSSVNPPPERKTHIQRTYQDDDTDSDVWLDIEMLDQIPQTGAGGQKTVLSFKCDPKNNSMRTPHTLTVMNPEDEDQTIDVTVWSDYKATDMHRTFVNCKPPAPTIREKKTKTISNRDIDDKFLDSDKQPPRDTDSYNEAIKQTGESDSDQYVCMEIINKKTESGTGKHTYGANDSSPVKGQKTVSHTDTCKSPTLPKPDTSGTNGAKAKCDPEKTAPEKIARMDPLQWIINVSWGGLAVDFGDKGEDAPDPEPKKPS